MVLQKNGLKSLLSGLIALHLCTAYIWVNSYLSTYFINYILGAEEELSHIFTVFFLKKIKSMPACIWSPIGLSLPSLFLHVDLHEHWKEL